MTKPSTAATLLMLANARDLGPISDWPPAGALIDDVLDTARGNGGLSTLQVNRLRVWSSRYTRIHPKVREWYTRHASEPAVGAALWSVLDHRPAPQGAAYGRLMALWVEDYGTPPGFDLLPRMS